MNRNFFRIFIAVIAIVVPVILLANGIYGSFIFTFSIPFLWQITYLNKSPFSLGFRKKSLSISIISGIISGIVLGVAGGLTFKLFGLTGRSLMNSQSLNFSLGSMQIEFSLAKELGYRLLTNSNSIGGLAVYFLFSLLLIGLGEEMFWRGFIQRKVANKVKTPLAISITAVLFGLLHSYIFVVVAVSQGIVLIILIGVAGAIWGYLYEKTNNIWSAAVSHGIAALIIWKYFFFAGVM